MKKQLKCTLFSIFLLIYAAFSTFSGVVGASHGISVMSDSGSKNPEPNPNPYGDLENLN